MQNLFGNTVVAKQKASLYDLALEKFKDDSNLLKEISSYLKSRKQARNYH